MHMISIILVTGAKVSRDSPTVTALDNVTLTCLPRSCDSAQNKYRVRRCIYKYEIHAYYWYRVDGDLPANSIQYNNTLIFHGVVPADGGIYYCIAASFNHCAISNNISVKVDGKEIILNSSYSYICVNV